ncbi:MAG: hypothetical protein HKO65_15445 [Gemmatimonadetes bacterium]|nr:hypothetical protein [Gemmatimonadota bacterium]NNM06487.1 hypothetical protein [Gemmatimonadota bacterium]
MRDRDDHQLRSQFDDLRRRERGRVPDFGTMVARAREDAARSGLDAYPLSQGVRRLPRRLAWGGSLVAAAAATVLLLILPPDTSDSEFVHVVQGFSADPAAGAWKSPTDGLLELPGSEILSTVPSISSRRWLLDPSGNPRRNEL